MEAGDIVHGDVVVTLVPSDWFIDPSDRAFAITPLIPIVASSTIFKPAHIVIQYKGLFVTEIPHDWDSDLDDNWMNWFMSAIDSIVKQPFEKLPLLLNTYTYLKPMVLKRLEIG